MVRGGNRQSQLLQEVKSILERTWSETTIRGDGQVVVVKFASTPVEVLPAFELNDGTYLICDTRNGGSYVRTAPHNEIQTLDVSDAANAGATRRLIRMIKQWQRHCNVPIKSFHIERIAIEYLDRWPYSRDLFWIDCMLMDFFAYLVSRAGGTFVMPRTNATIALGNAWEAKARTAQTAATKAFNYEQQNENVLAGIEWQSIFGGFIPLSV